jgi:hypothetical protein
MAKLERTTFEVSRASEYFDARQLSTLTGVAQTEFASVCLKELVDNALDGGGGVLSTSASTRRLLADVDYCEAEAKVSEEGAPAHPARPVAGSVQVVADPIVRCGVDERSHIGVRRRVSQVEAENGARGAQRGVVVPVV